MLPFVRTLRDRVRRFLLPLLARHRGEVRAMQDLRQFGEVARLSGVFAITMLVPIAFLAILSLSSIRSEELSFDADLRARGAATTTQLYDEVEGIFGRFESAALERILRGESPTSTLGELSPHLRAAFRFDNDGNLAAPFEPPLHVTPTLPPIGWQRAARAARALEADDPVKGAAAWRAARSVSTLPEAIGESMLGEARCLARSGRWTDAEELLNLLYADHATDRDQRGFRFGDLAWLEFGRQRFARGDIDQGVTPLIQLVDDQLSQTRPWTIGEEGEPAAVREALTLLEAQKRDPDWIGRSRSRLNELHAQLYWAELVEDEIELLYSRIPDGEFRYAGAGRGDSPAVWALVRAGENTYAFSFSVQGLLTELREKVARRTAADKDLAAALYLQDQRLPENALSIRSLGPWLPVALVSVEPKDPGALLASKSRRRTIRMAIVFSAVFVAFAGALWIARMIAWEVESARQRADFAANVSHELRSPITQIRLKGEALQLGLVDPGDDMQQHFDAIVRESERLSRLVDNVLDFAAIERGAKRYHPRPDDLRSVVASSVEAGRSALEEAGFTIELELQDDLPRVWIDRDAIGQVLTNLLSNALKYAPDGKWVRVRLHQTGDGVELSVADRGIGIGADEVPRVFDDFFRSTDPKVRRTKGTGIGLAIVRYIVEAHGGTIAVESTLGRGARFVVHLPLEPVATTGTGTERS
ncbi:MAG: HAMP domain-containing sensor histidine kinase [Myxococcota bacterium]